MKKEFRKLSPALGNGSATSTRQAQDLAPVYKEVEGGAELWGASKDSQGTAVLGGAQPGRQAAPLGSPDASTLALDCSQTPLSVGKEVSMSQT